MFRIHTILFIYFFFEKKLLNFCLQMLICLTAYEGTYIFIQTLAKHLHVLSIQKMDKCL